jgi:hypothetical protein
VLPNVRSLLINKHFANWAIIKLLLGSFIDHKKSSLTFTVTKPISYPVN